MNKLITTLLLGLIIISALGQFSRMPIGDGALYASEFAMILVFGTWFLWRSIVKRSFIIGWLDVTIITVLLTSLLSLILAVQHFPIHNIFFGLFYLIRLGLYLSLIRITRDIRSNDGSTIERFLNVIEYSIGGFALIGLIQYILFPDFAEFAQHGWDPHYFRVLSTFFDPNYAGLYLTVGFLVILERWYNQRSLFRSVVLLTVLLAILLTYSRSAYLAFFAGMTIFSWFKDKRIVLAMIIASVLTFVFIQRVQDRIIGAITIDESAMLRFDDYSKTYDIFKDNLIFGVGYNVFRNAQDSYGYFRDDRGVNYSGGHAGAGADNVILYIGATSGVVGLVAYGIFISTLLYLAIKSKKREILLSLLVAWLIHAQFVNSFFFVWIMSLMCIILGLYIGNDDEIKNTATN